MNYLSKVAGFGLATTMALAMQSSAQAYEFSFSGFQAGTHTASGTFTINDSTPQGVIDASDFEDWEIIVTNQAGITNTLFGPGSVSHNSDFYDARYGFVKSDVAIFDSTFLTFLDEWMIATPAGSPDFNQTLIFQHANGTNNALRVNSQQLNNFPASGFITANATAPTSVPFGVSTDLSILILGGLYGASRLRKAIAARKLISNQEA